MSRLTPEEVDALLPQTQCGLCGYGGCMPYAEAMIYEQATINLCPPGGVRTLKNLGKLLDQDPTPYIQEMEQKEKPRMVARIRESECIGCTKCLPACPVDAILGAAKQMHTVLSDACTGCELCIAPCPVDCIELVADTSENIEDIALETETRNLSRLRFVRREQRLSRELKMKNTIKQTSQVEEKRDFIKEALERAKAKKNIRE